VRGIVPVVMSYSSATKFDIEKCVMYGRWWWSYLEDKVCPYGISVIPCKRKSYC